MQNKISLAGDLGSGKSTVSAILCEALGAEYYSTGRVVRSIAERYGMGIAEFNSYMESHPEIDNEIDDGLCALSDDPRPLVIDSRMAWHFVKGTFRVYMSTDAEVSAARIMYANRRGEHSDSLDETVKATRARRESERKRYLEQYGEDITDLKNYDFVVDTTAATPDEVAAEIVRAFRLWQENSLAVSAAINPERLYYPDDEADSELMMQYSDKLDAGDVPPSPEVFFEDGNFYLKSGAEAALAYAFSMAPFIPVLLVSGSREGSNFVQMKNSL